MNETTLRQAYADAQAEIGAAAWSRLSPEQRAEAVNDKLQLIDPAGAQGRLFLSTTRRTSLS